MNQTNSTPVCSKYLCVFKRAMVLNDFLHPPITLLFEKIIPLSKLLGLVYKHKKKEYVHMLNIIIIHDVWIRENDAITLNIEQHRLCRKTDIVGENHPSSKVIWSYVQY